MWAYVLRSEKDGGLYVGHTNDVARRLAEHNGGHTQSLRSRRPLRLLKKIFCATREEAIKIEKDLKKGYKREELNKL